MSIQEPINRESIDVRSKSVRLGPVRLKHRGRGSSCVVDTLHELLLRIVALEGAGSDRGERGTTGRFGYRVWLRRRRDALMPGDTMMSM